MCDDLAQRRFAGALKANERSPQFATHLIFTSSLPDNTAHAVVRQGQQN